MSDLIELFLDFGIFFWKALCCMSISVAKWFLPKKYKCISNDTILITGGNRGIGRNIALELAHHKPKQMMLWGQCKESLEKTAKYITNLGVPCSFMICDVSEKEDVYKKAQEVKNTIGHVTILVNNAGVVFGKNIIESNDDEIIKALNVNTLAHFWTIKSFLPHMLSTNHGHVVSISSLIGLLALPGFAEYSTSKFAATGLQETVLYELHAAGKDGIHTTSVHPYLVDTDMFAGCSSRFPWLFPPLKQSYVAKKVVDAILTNQMVLLMPRIMYFIIFLKSFLPLELVLLVQKFTGVDKTVEKFLRAKKNKCS